MSETIMTPRHAWQPFTPRGVAAFAAASLGRLLFTQLVVAAFSAIMVVWFLGTGWFSVLREAIHRLPEGASIREGSLRWTTNSPIRLAENSLLSLVVNAGDAGALGRMADLEITLRHKHVRVSALLGFVDIPYPPDRDISLDQADVIPWWGAWERPVLAIIALAVIVALMVVWMALATLYCPVVWMFAFYTNRKLGFRESWKLSGAALMPGAMVALLGLFCYGWLRMDLLRLGLVFLLHFVAGWIYLLASPCFLPQDPRSAPVPDNPFTPPEDSGKAQLPRKPKPENPFAAPKNEH